MTLIRRRRTWLTHASRLSGALDLPSGGVVPVRIRRDRSRARELL